MHKRTFAAWLTAVVIAVLTLPAPRLFAEGTDPEQAAKERDIRELMDLSGAVKVGPQVMDQMIDQFTKVLPQVPAEYWTELRKEMTTDGLIKLIVPIYDRHFSHDEIKQLITFYHSPVGAKLAHELGPIMQESMAAGQAWGRDIAEHVTHQLRDKGYLKDGGP
jgi:uncharacterized protein